MLWVYVPRGTSLERIPVTSDADVPESAVWFDLVNPTPEEDKTVERKVCIAFRRARRCRKSRSRAASTWRMAHAT
jgi:Mg2+ and Co2+ transporters